jgi:peptidoglycan hydrolase-like protein with peptidoglycan-binding domain
VRLWKISAIVPLLALSLATGTAIALPTAASATTASCALFSFTNPYIGSPTDVPTVTLSEWATGPCVVMLQEDLNFVIKAGLKQDGIFGPKTLAAVKTYQGMYSGCTGGVDGIAGHYTMSCLVEGSG